MILTLKQKREPDKENFFSGKKNKVPGFPLVAVPCVLLILWLCYII